MRIGIIGSGRWAARWDGALAVTIKETGKGSGSWNTNKTVDEVRAALGV